MSRRDTILNLRHQAPLVLPSMLLCDFGDLRTEVGRLASAGFHGLHLDVMDGVYVPNFSYGISIVEAFRSVTELPLDVHLMMVHPERYVSQFARAGADLLTFHIEACAEPVALVQQIRDEGVAVGVAIDRDTPVDAIRSIADQVDLVLIMTIKAGFGGQQFIPELLQKLHQVRELCGDRPVLEVDGGVNADTIEACVEAGAEWLVAGSAVFKAGDYSQAHRALMDRARAAQGDA